MFRCAEHHAREIRAKRPAQAAAAPSLSTNSASILACATTRTVIGSARPRI
jgi:hypothetical protein